jgi:hypothetical protein
MTQSLAMTRRNMITASVSSLLVGPSLAGSMRARQEISARNEAHWPGYAKAIAIDGAGGPGGYIPGDDGTAPLTPEMVRDARESGITAVSITLGPVGNQPDLIEKTFRWIAVNLPGQAMHRRITCRDSLPDLPGQTCQDRLARTCNASPERSLRSRDHPSRTR